MVSNFFFSHYGMDPFSMRNKLGHRIMNDL
jgi:hypothetical protein